MAAKPQTRAGRETKSFEIKMRDARYVVAEDRFVVAFENGKEYRFARSLVECDDGTETEQVRLDKRKIYFRVMRASNNEYEVPWDRVLYEAEASYPHHRKTRLPKKTPKIGQRIREKRCAAGLSQAVLANASGLLRVNLSRIESGKHTPTLETLERIAKALGIPVADLLAVES